MSPGARIVKVSPEAAKLIPGLKLVSAIAAADVPINWRLLISMFSP